MGSEIEKQNSQLDNIQGKVMILMIRMMIMMRSMMMTMMMMIIVMMTMKAIMMMSIESEIEKQNSQLENIQGKVMILMIVTLLKI